MATLDELTEAHAKSERLLTTLPQIPSLLEDEEAWASERRNVFSSLRRGFVDCITSGCLESAIFGNRHIEEAYLFLLTIGLRSERRRANVVLCFKCLSSSESWSLVLRGSRRVLQLMKELPEDFRREVIDAADAPELLVLLGQPKKKKKRGKKPCEMDAPVPQEDTCDVPQPADEEMLETSVSDVASRTCPQDFLAENSLSVSDSGVEMKSQTCPEDLLTEPSLSLSIHSPDLPEVPKPPSPLPLPSPQLPGAAFQRPPRPQTPSRNFGGWPQQSPASKPRKPGRWKDLDELGPRCPNGKPMTRELMMKEAQRRREGPRTPTLRRLLGGDTPTGAETPSGLLGRMKQKLLSRAPASPSPASRRSHSRDFGGGDRFGVRMEDSPAARP